MRNTKEINLFKIKCIIKILVAVVIVFYISSVSMAAEILGDLKIHGFASQGFLISDKYNYLAHDSKKGSFQYNELGINFTKK